MSNVARPRLDLPSDDEVCSRREHGLYPYVLWLPPLGSEHFSREALRQAKALIEAAEEEREVLEWIRLLAASQQVGPDRQDQSSSTPITEDCSTNTSQPASGLRQESNK